jgi:hypothetical protein
VIGLRPMGASSILCDTDRRCQSIPFGELETAVSPIARLLKSCHSSLLHGK